MIQCSVGQPSVCVLCAQSLVRAGFTASNVHTVQPTLLPAVIACMASDTPRKVLVAASEVGAILAYTFSVTHPLCVASSDVHNAEGCRP
jgi:hypothetical protein